MNVLRLDLPVHTVDQELLLPQGTTLSPSVLSALVGSEKNRTQKKFSFLRYGSVKRDIRHFLAQPPYNIIFAEKEKTSDILNLMQNVYFAGPLLQSLGYFQQNDFNTYSHILMVFALSALLAKDIIVNRKQRLQEISAGPIHDIGKLCVPLSILRKSTPLTRREHIILSHHSVAGYVLLCHYCCDARGLAARVARDHHERRNASGYPRGIHLKDHMIEIIAVSDVYDALLSPRPYRQGSYDNRTALEEITGMAERREIGWSVVKALVAHNRRAKIHYSKTRVSSEKRGTPPAGNLHGVIAEEEASGR